MCMSDHECNVADKLIADGFDAAAAKEKIRKLEARHDKLVGDLYGQGFEIRGYHLNGDLIGLDVFFEDNGWLETIK